MKNLLVVSITVALLTMVSGSAFGIELSEETRQKVYQEVLAEKWSSYEASSECSKKDVIRALKYAKRYLELSYSGESYTLTGTALMFSDITATTAVWDIHRKPSDEKRAEARTIEESIADDIAKIKRLREEASDIDKKDNAILFIRKILDECN